ncbi:MAG: DUF4878 domain-containing protein [Candidatus Aminicenantes bacterium]|nr:MAG: DUF4878 domain-containing protein [Candidatus Aminicenantes bacterium]
MKHRFILLLVMMYGLMVLLVNCGAPAGDEGTLKQLYHDYHNALQEEDIQALKQYISSRGQEEMLGEGASMKIKMIKEMMPTGIKITKTTVSGDTAVLEVKGKMGKQTMTGKVNVLKEDGEWKIDKESWTMSIEIGGESDQQGYAGPVQPFMKDPKQLPQVYQVLTGHQGEVTSLAFTPDNRYLVSVSYGDYSLRVWDPFTGEELSVARTPNRVRSMALFPDGSSILTADAYKDIILWPLSAGIIGSPQTLVKDAGDAVAISPDGKTIAAAGWKQPVHLWDFNAGTMIKAIGSNNNQRVLKFSLSGDVLVGGGEGVTYSTWDTKKWKEKIYRVNKVMPDSGISSIDISRDGEYMATGHSDSSIVIFNLKKRRELHNFYVRDAATSDVKFSADNKILATAQYDKNIYLWDVDTGKRLGVLKKHTDSVNSLAFSWNGSMLASGGEDRKIFIWGSGTPQQPITPDPGELTTPKTPTATDPGEQMVEIDGHLNLIKYPDARRFTRHWQTKGEVSIEKDAEEEDNYNFVIRYSGMIWQDVRINADGRYALLISWASSERVNPDDDQTGFPYLYGYMLNKADPNKINTYLQGEEMMLRPNNPNEWEVIYGIFKVPAGTGGIRLFLQQADGHSPQNGSKARFDEPGVFLFDTEEQAQAFAREY